VSRELGLRATLPIFDGKFLTTAIAVPSTAESGLNIQLRCAKYGTAEKFRCRTQRCLCIQANPIVAAKSISFTGSKPGLNGAPEEPARLAGHRAPAWAPAGFDCHTIHTFRQWPIYGSRQNQLPGKFMRKCNFTF
jgi:hypothetical protein